MGKRKNIGSRSFEEAGAETMIARIRGRMKDEGRKGALGPGRADIITNVRPFLLRYIPSQISLYVCVYILAYSFMCIYIRMLARPYRYVCVCAPAWVYMYIFL